MAKSRLFTGGGTHWFSGLVSVALAVAMLPVLPATPGAADRTSRWTPPTPDEVTPVALVREPTWGIHPTWSAGGREVRGDSDVAWPEAREESVKLDVPAVSEATALDLAGGDSRGRRAGDLPVWITPVGSAAETAVQESPVLAVQAHDQAVSRKVGVTGLVLEVSGADTAKAALTVDYSGFAMAAGGDWASRLRLVQLPRCALTTPGRAGCSAATALPSRNDVTTQTVTAVAPLDAQGDSTVLAVAAASGGDNGDYSATSLSPASTWDVSAQTGAFSWSLPLRTVPAVGGPTPQLALSYSSQAVDGRTGGTNTQGSWAGDGFDLWTGYVERSYKSCAEDTGPFNGKDPNNKGRPTGDQCWWKANATLSLNGRSTELVDVGGGQWRGMADDGSKVELLTGAANGAANGEYWKVTTTDGTQYFLGRHTGPGGSSATTPTDSTWTTAVFGNHPGDPGYVAGNFAASRTTQAWRWNLDYVVDPHGNTMTMFYAKETGAYGRELDPNKRTTYDRGGHLTRIEYGNRADATASTPAAARVELDVADRCKAGATCFDGNGRAIAASFPDTPFDQYCYATPCTDQLSPTYWTQKRLAKVRTQVLGSDGTYSNVESWSLRHEYLDAGVLTGEGIPMFLRGITHAGHVTTAGGAEVADPEIVFDPGSEPLPNRVDGPADNRTALNRWRIKRVTTETGAQVLVNYKPADCTRAALPVPHDNTKLCFPQHYAPEGETPTLDWFHKYVVAKVTVNDNAAGSEPQETHYDYLDAPAWHYDDSELVKEDKRTWGAFRGFGHVRVRKGFTTGPQLTSEQRFLRGMDGDRQPNGTRDVWVTDSWGNRIEDHKAYSGVTLEETGLDGSNGQWVEGTLSTPTTPVRTGASGSLEAWMVNTGSVRSYSRSTVAPGGVRWTRKATTYNADNLPVAIDDLGDETIAGDDRCTRHWYARNPGNWMLDRIKRTETVGVACSATPSLPGDLLSSSRTTYDNPDGNWDTELPSRGLPVKVEQIDRWNGSTPIWVTTATSTYDRNGRVTAAADALGRTTRTSFTPESAGPLTESQVINPKGHKTTTSFAAAWQQPLTLTDPNGIRTDLAYDGLGRLTKAWLPGRAKAANPTSPNLEFAYLVRNTKPTAVTTRTLVPTATGTAYVTQIGLFDGQMRQREVQTQATGGGRTIAETHYNGRGETAWVAAAYFDESGAGPSVELANDPESRADIPAVTEYTYDGAGRQTAEARLGFGGEVWRTTTAYGGDLTTVTPPEGGTKAQTLVDGRGQTVEIRRYHQRTGPSGYDATRYAYTDTGQLASVVDPAGNTWRYFYDQRDRKIRDEDPDKGISHTEYNVAGEATKTTDARRASLVTSYDDLGRRRTVREGSDTGPIRAEWVYDILANGTGKLARTTRFANGEQYVNEIAGYDSAGRPTGTKLTLPVSEGALCAAGGSTPCTYSYSMTYKLDGQVASSVVPRAGDLGGEQLSQNYNDLGLPTTITSSMGTLLRSVYYDKTGRITQRVLGELGKQVAVDHRVDEVTNRLEQIVASLESRPTPLHLAYSYDDASNVTRIQDSPYGQTPDTQCFRYDHMRRLVDAWTPGGGDCAAARNTAALGGPAPYWRTYDYAGTEGKTGSRTKETWHNSAGDITRTYSYPAPAGAAGTRPHGLSSVATHRPAGSDVVDRYEYDASGNTTKRSVDGVQYGLAWDVDGELASMTQGTETVSYLYDSEGAPLIRRDPAGTGTTLYLPGQELNVTPGSSQATTTRYYEHGGMTVGVRLAAAGLSFLVGDHHKTAELAVKASDLSVTRRRSFPFGENRGQAAPGWPGQRGFVGGNRAPHGLMQLGARFYEPAIGRFVSVDPIIDTSDPQQMHGYAYGNNAPPTFADPTGMMYTIGDGGGGGGIGSSASAGSCTARSPDRCADQAGLNKPTPGSLTQARKRPDGKVEVQGADGHWYAVSTGRPPGATVVGSYQTTTNFGNPLSGMQKAAGVTIGLTGGTSQPMARPAPSEAYDYVYLDEDGYPHAGAGVDGWTQAPRQQERGSLLRGFGDPDAQPAPNSGYYPRSTQARMAWGMGPIRNALAEAAKYADAENAGILRTQSTYYVDPRTGQRTVVIDAVSVQYDNKNNDAIVVGGRLTFDDKGSQGLRPRLVARPPDPPAWNAPTCITGPSIRPATSFRIPTG